MKVLVALVLYLVISVIPILCGYGIASNMMDLISFDKSMYKLRKEYRIKKKFKNDLERSINERIF